VNPPADVGRGAIADGNTREASQPWSWRADSPVSAATSRAE
jgi:hypothetical protein